MYHYDFLPLYVGVVFYARESRPPMKIGISLAAPIVVIRERFASHPTVRFITIS